MLQGARLLERLDALIQVASKVSIVWFWESVVPMFVGYFYEFGGEQYHDLAAYGSEARPERRQWLQ